jgi:hypothetical protein
VGAAAAAAATRVGATAFPENGVVMNGTTPGHWARTTRKTDEKSDSRRGTATRPSAAVSGYRLREPTSGDRGTKPAEAKSRKRGTTDSGPPTRRVAQGRPPFARQ